MAIPGLDAIFNYIALLIDERPDDKPLLLIQLMPAIKYKFSDFSPEKYALANIKAFIEMGEKAQYFKLVNTGNVQTAYLSSGAKKPVAAVPVVAVSTGETDQRRLQLMNTITESLLQSDRGDQLLATLQGFDWNTPAFEAFLRGQEKSLSVYVSRGKLRRVRDFLKVLKDQGEDAAISSWRSNRSTSRLPVVPPIPPEAVRRQVLIYNLIQGQIMLTKVERNLIDPIFFAVLIFCRDQLRRDRSWDWVAALDILELEARYLVGGQIVPQAAQTKTGALAARLQTAELAAVSGMDEKQVNLLVAQMRREVGMRTAMLDPTPIWREYVDTPSMDVTLEYLENRPDLLNQDGFLEWLDSEISRNVQQDRMDIVRKLANKSAIVIGARQLTLAGLRAQPMKIKAIYESVMGGVNLLKQVFAFLGHRNDPDAIVYLVANRDLYDEEAVGAILDEQLIRAAHQGSVVYYRQVRNRISLWRNIIEFGKDEGLQQYNIEMKIHRSDRILQAEMGILLLVRANGVNELYDILERFPAAGSKEGLDMIDGMLDMLSAQGASQTEFDRHYKVKHLIERCTKVGVDRALAELQ